jgi:hypothetical protein
MTVPWFIGGGAEHSAEVARLLAYHAVDGGSEGVGAADHMRVMARPVPGNGVRILPGAISVLNRSSGGIFQSYIDRVPIEKDLDIAATGSGGGRTDLIVYRVEDPQYPPWNPPSNVAEGPYGFYRVISGVPSGTTTAEELNLGYSAYALAKVTLPASTATVQQAHITDLRKIANPRAYRRLFAYNLVQADGDFRLTSTTAQWWPELGPAHWRVDIPEWAVKANLIGTWNGVRTHDSIAYGRVWARIGAAPGWGEGLVDTQHQSWDMARTGSGYARETWATADDVNIPEALRGTDQAVRLLGRRDDATAGTNGPLITAMSSISFDIEFYEIAI